MNTKLTVQSDASGHLMRVTSFDVLLKGIGQLRFVHTKHSMFALLKLKRIPLKEIFLMSC